LESCQSSIVNRQSEICNLQSAICNLNRRYLVGPAGAGKTTRIADALAGLIESGVRPDRVLCLVAQHGAIARMRRRLADVRTPTQGEPVITTINAFAQRNVSLFFPLLVNKAEFARVDREPVFTTVESAQYFVNQHLEAHMPAFEGLKLHRPRIVSQVIDNMNRAATSGFALTEIAARLRLAWPGDVTRNPAFEAVQQTALDFRAFCLRHTLLDFSLTMALFGGVLLQDDGFTGYARARYRHLLIDNVEEETPALHDLARLLLPGCETALIAEDDPGGYRIFLGADAASARTLRALCADGVESATRAAVAETVPSPARFGEQLAAVILDGARRGEQKRDASVTVLPAVKYWTSMVQQAVDTVRTLVDEGVQPAEIAIVAPYVEDVLRFELAERLGATIGVRTLRPSRPLHDHPVVRALIVFAKLSHKSWRLQPAAGEIARALTVALGDLDIVRAQLLAEQITRIQRPDPLPALDDVALWTRVGARFAERYDVLRGWLANWLRQREADAASAPLDLFWQQLFTDVLSVREFGLHADRDGATVVARLVRLARQFREVFALGRLTPEPVRMGDVQVFGDADKQTGDTQDSLGLTYIQLLSEGMLAARGDLAPENEGGVLLAPAHALITSDVRVRVQIWLDAQAVAWHERIYQPLTHPFVLSRGWPAMRAWSDMDELQTARESLARQVRGLAYRCSERMFIASSQLSVSGQEESGLLLRALQRLG
jgi:hypothetical protein